MKEDFLQYAWKHRRFTRLDLATDQGTPIEILNPGRQNHNAGPDFLDARLRIGDTLWAGNVEVHIAASDWFRHEHDRDPAYDTVILHVVYTPDAEIRNGKGQVIPTLSIKDLIDYQTYRYYKSWLKSGGYIPCDPANRAVPPIIKTSAIQSAAVERMRRKSEVYLDHLNETRGDLDASFYRVLLRAFGLKVNALPFEQLAKITPFSVVRKLRSSVEELEALFLGQAGFLSGAEEESAYVSALRERYAYLVRKHRLQAMPRTAWKLFRLRPPNFPQVRLAQLARFFHCHARLAQTVMELDGLPGARSLFDISLDRGFWLTHYTLDKPSAERVKSIGEATTDLLVVNAVVPFLFALSRYNKDDSYRSRAIDLLEAMPPEKNAVVRKFAAMDFHAKSALDTQGIIRLKQFDCEHRKCLTCQVGIHLLKDHGKT